MILNAWEKRMIPPVIEIAGAETCHLVNTNGPSKATARTITVAIATARHATVRRNVGSVPRVALANGRIALSGPRVRKNRIPMSPKLNSKSTAEHLFDPISAPCPNSR
jgi:hypothetical protein